MKKEDIEGWIRNNGNVQFSMKELVIGLHTKIDKIDERLNKGDGSIGDNRTNIKNIYWIIGVSTPLFLTLILFIINKVI